MPLERRNPLPAGRYWLFLDQAAAPLFDDWKASHRDAVKLARTSFDADTGYSWYVFSVSKPVPWQPESFGWPNIADASVKDPTDVTSGLDAVPPPDILEAITELAAGSGMKLFWGALALGAFAILAGKVFK